MRTLVLLGALLATAARAQTAEVEAHKNQVERILAARAKFFEICPSGDFGREIIIFAVRSDGSFEVLNKPLQTKRAQCLAVQLENARAGQTTLGPIFRWDGTSFSIEALGKTSSSFN